MAFLYHEDEKYVSFITVDDKAQEFAKIVKKEDIEGIEVIYAQMLENAPKNSESDIMFI